VLPIIVEWFGRGLDHAPTTLVERTDGGWKPTFIFGTDGVSAGLATVPIQT
jgi:hypothetical protein